jgi:hypothetical protein
MAPKLAQQKREDALSSDDSLMEDDDHNGGVHGEGVTYLHVVLRCHAAMATTRYNIADTVLHA